jgi:hypothetical protein
MMGSLRFNSVVSPQMAPKRGFSFGKLSMECYERHPHANTAKCEEQKGINITYPASRANGIKKKTSLGTLADWNAGYSRPDTSTALTYRAPT